jgi:ribose transport system permease protein
MAQTSPPFPADAARRPALSRRLAPYATELSLLAVFALTVLVFSTASPFFLTWTNMVNLGQTLATGGIVAVTMTLVIISGGIDLSVGSVAALAGVTTSFFWTDAGLPLGVAAVLGVGAGVLVGLVNGFLVTRIKINPLIATLAMFSIVRGLAFVISNGQTNQLNNDAFKFLGRGNVAGVPFSLLVLLALFLLFGFVLSNTHFGRTVYALGGNPEACRLAGINGNRTLMWVYLLSGLFAGVAGLFIASQLALSAPRAAVGLELTAIAAVVLGGTSLSGGKGTLVGTFFGVLILRVLANGLVLLNISSFYQDVASGLVLLLAVGFDQIRQRIGERV